MYVFIYKDSTSVYAYTKHKDIAKDFYHINSDRFRMIKLSKSEIEEGIDLPSGGNISYYNLTGSDKKVYQIPLTESEANEVMTKCLHIFTTFSYIYDEVVPDNKYGLKNKYLNVIGELTSVLKKKNYNKYIDGLLKTNYSNINSIKVYQDLFH